MFFCSLGVPPPVFLAHFGLKIPCLLRFSSDHLAMKDYKFLTRLELYMATPALSRNSFWINS